MSAPENVRVSRLAIGIAAGVMALTLLLGGAGVAIGVAASSGVIALPESSGSAPGGGVPTGDGRAAEATRSDIVETTGGEQPSNGDETGSEESVATPSATVAPPEEAPEDTIVPTVLILDASGSMVRDAPGGGTRMESAKAAAITLVESLPDDSQIGLSVFGTGTGNDDSEQAAGCLDTRILLPVGDLDRAAFTAAIGTIGESGFTPLGPAMRHAAEQLPGDGPARIVLVSDGVDTCAPPPSCDVAQELRSANPDLTIYAIGFAVDADEAAQEQLQCIGSVGGGEYYAAANAAQLAAKLRLASDPGSAADSVTNSGFQDFRLGMSLEAALAVEPTLSEGETIDRILYVYCDYATLQFRDGVLIGILPTDERPTADGLVAGDDLELGYQLYGEPTDRGVDDEGDYVVFPSASDGVNGYRVYYSGTTIRYILVCICGPNQASAALDFAGWEIGFGTLGPLTVGTSFDEAFAALPDGGAAARQSLAENGGCPVARVRAEGEGPNVTIFGTWTDSGPEEVVSEFSVYRSNLGAVPLGLPRTALNIGVGSTASEVERAYPGATFVESDRIGNYAVVSSRSGKSIVFQLDGSVVVGVWTGNWTAYPYEFCG